MSKSKSEIDAAKIAASKHHRATKRASEIRVRLNAGKTITDEQRRFLEGYDALVLERAGGAGHLLGRPTTRTVDDTGSPPAGSASAGSSEGTAEVPGAGPLLTTEAARSATAGPVPSPQLPPPTVRTVAPPPPSPPRLTAPPPPPPVQLGISPGDWRLKYGAGPGGDREFVCVQAAQYYTMLLIAVADQIKESGSNPLVNPRSEDFQKVVVLAMDELLPPTVKISPKVEVVGATSALLVQRLLRSKQFNEAKEKRESTARVNARLHSVPMPSPRPAPEPEPAGTDGRVAPSGDRTDTVREPDKAVTHERAPEAKPAERTDSPFAGKPLA